ncbi:MAG: hypothetical protein ACHQRO_13590, partial [Vicinamibacteria bacterium]
MTRARLRTAALSGWLLLGAIGCQTRTGDVMDWGPISTPPWTVGGAKPGMTPEDVERLLGPPTSSDTSYGRTTTQWAEQPLDLVRGHARLRATDCPRRRRDRTPLHLVAGPGLASDGAEQQPACDGRRPQWRLGHAGSA